jgi:hypothetical protein
VASHAGTEVTLGDVLPIAPGDDRLPDTVRELLIEAWGDRAASEIGAMNVFAIARELLAVMTDQNDYSNDARFRAAEAVHDLLSRAGLAAAATAAAPLRVTVDMPKSPAEMPLRDLLALLAAEPERYGEIRPYLDGHPQVRAAQSHTSGAWAIPGARGGIDVEATLAYVGQVSRPHASAQRMFKGRRPVKLSAALGLDERALIHPFTGRPVQGPDSNGFDFSQLNPELHEALLWAAVTGHSAWPQQIDLYTYSEEVFRTPLPRRWQLILDDYKAARSAEDDSTRIITRYWPEGLSLEQVIDLASGLPGGRRAGRAAPAGYQQLVEQKAALSGTLDGFGSGNDYSGGVYERIAVSGSGSSFRNVVITQGGSISGSGGDGNILLPPGVRVRISGSGNQIRQQNMTWKDLAEYLGLA